jgi:hypothetical protein
MLLHTNPHSTVQSDEHPSRWTVLPSSHVSVPTTMPSPHFETQVVFPHASVVHFHPYSFEQVLLHPSPLTVLPSSQSSSDACFPSPQLDEHTLGALLQSNPHSTEQVDEHPSPFWASPSSHVSVPVTLPSLHTEAQVLDFNFDTKYLNLKTRGMMSISSALLLDGSITIWLPLYSTVIESGSRGAGESDATAMVPSEEPERYCRVGMSTAQRVSLYCASDCLYKLSCGALSRLCSQDAM